MTKKFFERGKQIAKWADNNMKQHKWHKEIKIIPRPRCHGKVQIWKIIKEIMEKQNETT